jgi:tight adherence protein B
MAMSSWVTPLVGLGLGSGLLLLLHALTGPRRVPGTTRSQPTRGRRPWGLAPLVTLLEEAGFDRLSPSVVLAGGLLGGLLAGAGLLVLLPIPALGVITVCMVPLWGYAYVARVKSQRATRLRRAWPSVIDHLRAGVRSGHDVAGAVIALPESFPPDISAPVRTFEKEIIQGFSTDDALAELARRFADPVGDRIVEVLRMAHEVGGTNLPGVLLELQKSVRADIAVREDAHAQQSWIRSASLLAVAAPWAVLVVIGTREATINAYQTSEGGAILILGAIVSLVAFTMMKKIGALPTQRRWLG